MLSHFDLFQNVITQRSDNETGVWLSGLDVLSSDALHLRGHVYQAPPVICYLDRVIGAAIRHARTCLPGGGYAPVAIVKVPRERMVGSAISSSLLYEVGHQAAALLDLVESLRPLLRGIREGNLSQVVAWQSWERWISEMGSAHSYVAQPRYWSHHESGGYNQCNVPANFPVGYPAGDNRGADYASYALFDSAQSFDVQLLGGGASQASAPEPASLLLALRKA